MRARWPPLWALGFGVLCTVGWQYAFLWVHPGKHRADAARTPPNNSIATAATTRAAAPLPSIQSLPVIQSLPSILPSHTAAPSPLLRVCVVTAWREEPYVARALEALGPTRDPRVMVVDVDNSTAGLPVSARGYAAHALRRTREPCDHSPEPTEGEALPSCAARQLGLDVAAALGACLEAALREGARWVMLHEDDVVACAPGALDEVERTLAGLNASSTRVARFARLARAMAVPTLWLPRLVAGIVAELDVRPWDRVALPGRWAGADTVEYVHPRGLLFTHVGHVSTLADRNTPRFHASYDRALRYDTCGDSIT